MLRKIGKFILRYKFIILGLLIASFGILGFLNTKKTYSEKTYTTIWDGTIATSFSGGTGTEQDPYIISDGSELAYFFYMINGENMANYFNKYYVLDNNINLNGYDFSNINTTKTFSGSLDGKGYTISNFTLNNCRLDNLNKIEKCALFNNLSNAKIKNINFIDGTIELTNIDKDTEVSLLANSATESIIKNISFSNITFNNNLIAPIEETTTEETSEEQPQEETEVIEEQETIQNEEPVVEEKLEETIENTEIEETITETNNLATNKVVATTLLNVVDENNEIKLLENELDIEEPKTIKASGILITDNGDNEISNIHITLNTNIENTSLLVYNYDNSNVFNIVTNDKEIPLSTNNTIDTNKYTYKIVDNELVINNDITKEEIFELLESSEEYEWTYENNTLRLRNNGVDPTPLKGDDKDISGGTTRAGASGISGNVVTVDDIEADRNYYLGLNYTNNAPNITYTETYSTSNLITATINYYGYGKDKPSVSGYVSPLSGESNLNTYVYKKVYPKETCSTGGECIKIELIDNPWSKRPTDKMFNGWYSDSSNVTITLDLQTYTRYAEVKLNGATSVEFNLYTSWVPGILAYISDGWEDIDDNLDNYGFTQVVGFNQYYTMTNYYYIVHVNRYFSGQRNDYVNQGDYWTQSTTAPYCNTRGGCDYMRQETATSPVNGREYYARTDLGGGHYSFDQATPTPTLVREGKLNYGDELAGLYKKHRLSNGQSRNGFYNVTSTEITLSNSYWGSSGEKLTYYNLNKLSGNCSTTTYCEVFEYIPYISGSNIYTEGDTNEYYYLTTRDTNIVFLNGNYTDSSRTNVSDVSKPLTLTSYNNNTNNYNTYTWSPMTNTDSSINNDMAFDYLRINTTVRKATGENTPGTTPAIRGNGHNLKMGRNIGRTNSYMSFSSVVSFSNNSSSTTPIKFNTRIESGYYNTLAGLTKTSGYFESKVTYGNDLDRINNDNSKLDVAFIAISVAGGDVHSSNDSITDALKATIKSGTYGSNRANYMTGVYVGARTSGNLYSPISMIVEGGSIYNITGGPLVAESRANVNMIKIFIKGGTIDNIFGGAGMTATYGNRIVQLTGGQINYSVVGGSNGVQASGTNGKLNGKTFVYAGGNVIVGNETYVNNNTKESASNIEAGSIFGSGNGKSGTAATSQIGDTLGTNVVIDSGATIRRNVYGGGNFGSMGSQATGAVAANIKIIDGTVAGSVFGGGNNNGIGKNNYNSTVNIEMTGGNVGSIYGGSNVSGNVYASTTIDVTGGTVGYVYGGGMGSTTQVRDSVTVNIGGSTTSPTILHDVYGGSEEGQVNTSAGKSTTVNINSGNISGSVFGGGNKNGIGTSSAASSTTVTVNGGTILQNVYGGSNVQGTVYGPSTVKINKGSVKNVFGGGLGVGTFVRDDISVTIGGIGDSPTIGGNVYGGSELGTVNGTRTNGAYDSNKKTTVVVSNGTITGSVFGGAKGSSTTVPFVYGKISTTINGGNIGEVYGGFDANGEPKGTANDSCVVTINSGVIGNAYGGGYSTNVPTTNITLQGNAQILSSIYGGSNHSGTITNSNLYIKSGITANAYGGNNEGGTNNQPNVTVTGGTISNSLYGSGNRVGSTETHVTINPTTQDIMIGYGGTDTYPGVFGGANQAGVTTTNVTIAAPTGSFTTRIKNAFGGSNTSGNITTANLTIEGGQIEENAFGGNNKGGNVTTPNIIINGGRIGNAYGGNNEGGISNNTDLIINGGTIVNNAYGGGNKIGVTTSKIHLNGGTIEGSAYGGSNTTGDVITSYVYVTNSNNNLSVGSVYGGNNQGGSTRTTNIEVTNGNIDELYGGGNMAPSGATNILVNNGTIGTLYGGGDNADVSEDINITIQDGRVNNNLFGGGNIGNVGSTSRDATITINVNNGTYGTIYAGGNGTTSGDNGKLIGSTILNIQSGRINGNVFGGGNNGKVTGDTIVNIKGGFIYNNAYAGGNGSTATVLGNNTINISGTTMIGHEVSCEVIDGKRECIYDGSVFGGGNAAATGSIDSKKSTIVNIAGGTIFENVYGGAYGYSDSANNLTSVIYGTATVNIGNAVPDSGNISRSPITIYGTIFGGGEKANNDNENYNFDAISVTDGIEINIDGTGYETLNTYGSIFGSGNASSSQGPSIINITNYGTREIPHSNISIQRTDVLTIDNSHIVLSGTTDSTNDYSNVPFALSRIDELNLKNNSTLYLYEGSNLLKEFNSQTSSGAKAAVTIEENSGEYSITRNVDNRVYMYPGKVLNIATTQNVSQDGYGQVNGMTFFGMFKIDKDSGQAKTGIYQDTTTYPSNANEVSFEYSTYVLGEHKLNHNIEVDGFYSNFYEEADLEEGLPAKFSVGYITPTPENASYYMWQIGEDTLVIDVELTASKYATLGTKEIVFNQSEELSRPNTSFMITGFDYTELETNSELIQRLEIPRLASTSEDANTKMGLRIEASNQGWLTTGYTDFVSNNPTNPISGVTNYIGSNTSEAPTLLMYLYHSKNIDEAGDFGKVGIDILAITQIDDLTKSSKPLHINITITRAIYDTAEYEASITPGRKYELFTNTATNITNKSTFSAYYSLFDMSKTEEDENGNTVETYNGNIYALGNYRHVLTTTYAFPAGTKITMIDLNDSEEPEYFYHVITSYEETRAITEINTNGDYRYDLSLYEKMGAYGSGIYYDDEKKYYNSSMKMTDEEFIFIIDLEDVNIVYDPNNPSKLLNKSIYMELIDDNPSVPDISLLSVQRDTQIFSIYTDKDATIEIKDQKINKNSIYIGDEFKAEANIDVIQEDLENAKQVFDTKTFESKLGAKITLINSEDEVVSGTSLIGLTYNINDNIYFPNIDGSTRIKITDRVDQTKLRITVNSGTSSIETGQYKLRIEVFASSDGIYYGTTSNSSYIELPIYIINEIYGLKVDFKRSDKDGNIIDSKEDMVVSSKNGHTEDNNDTISMYVTYSSGLTNPNIKLKMYRRLYNEELSTSYEEVEICDYVDRQLNSFCNNAEGILHTIINNPSESQFFVLHPIDYSKVENPINGKDHLQTGTYKLEFILYENLSDTQIKVGSVEKYIIIR